MYPAQFSYTMHACYTLCTLCRYCAQFVDTVRTPCEHDTDCRLPSAIPGPKMFLNYANIENFRSPEGTRDPSHNCCPIRPLHMR